MSSTKSTCVTGPGARARMASAQADAFLCVCQRAAANCSASAATAHSSSQRQDGESLPSRSRCPAASTANGTNSGRMYNGRRDRETQNTSNGNSSHSASSICAESRERPSRVRQLRTCPAQQCRRPRQRPDQKGGQVDLQPPVPLAVAPEFVRGHSADDFVAEEVLQQPR